MSFGGLTIPMAVHPGDDWISTRIVQDGHYGNLGVVKAAADQVKKSGRALGLMVDAGTNIGVFSLFGA